MVKDHSDSEKGNPLPPHRLLLSININQKSGLGSDLRLGLGLGSELGLVLGLESGLESRIGLWLEWYLGI